MSDPLLAFEGWSQWWVSRLWTASWQGAVLVAAVYAVTHFWRSLSPRVACWLWRLVCLKLLVLLAWTAPISIPLLLAERAVEHVAERTYTVDLAANSAEVRVPIAHALDKVEVLPDEPVTRGVSIVTLLGAAWIVGALVRASLTAVQWRSIERLCRAAVSADSSRLADAYRTAGERLAVRRQPRLCLSTEASGPLLARIVRPVIVLPADCEQRFDDEELTVMLAHELAHAERRDLLWNWLATVVSWIFFFHPLVWLLTRRWSAAQEAACDELLIQRHVTRPSAYGQLLVKLATCWPADSQAALVSVGVLGAYRHLERRVLDLARVRNFSVRRTLVAALAISLAAVPGIVPWRLVAREPAERANATPTTNKDASANAAQEVVSGPRTVVEEHFSLEISGGFDPPLDSQNTTPATGPKFSAEHQQAVEELKSLGAYVDTLVTTDGQNNVSVVFTDPWKGREEDLALLEKVEHLGLVYLDCQKLSPQGLAVLKKLRTRPALELYEVTDEQLEVLRDWSGIDRLSLVSRHLSDRGLEIVTTLPALTRLQVANTAPADETPQQTITDAGVAALKKCRLLEQLSLMSWPKLEGTTLDELAELDKLEQLQLFQNALDDRGLAALAKLTQLKQFSFDGEKVTTAGYAALAEMRQLEQLNIVSATQFDETAAAHLAKLVQLRALGLYEAPLTDAALAPLAGLTNLTGLYLSGGQITDAGLAHLKDLVHLQIVNLSWDLGFTDAGVANFSRMTELVSLDLPAKGVTDEGLAALAPCRQLQRLGLQGTSVHGAGLAQLSQLPKLKTLMLGRSAIEDDELGQLAMFPALEELYLDDTSISDAGAAALAELKRLKKLDLRNTKLTDKGLAQLAGMQQLRSLELEGSGVTEAGIKALAEKLPRLQVNEGALWSFSYVMPTAAFSPSSTAVTGTIEVEPDAAEPAAPPAKESIPQRAPKAEHDETRAAAQWATEHLRKLGATPLGHGQVGIQSGWKGTDDDLKYIAMIPDLKWLFLDLDNVGATSIGNLNLRAPVENLVLGAATDDRLAQIKRLPECQRLTLIQDKLTPEGFRRLSELAQGLEHLTLNGAIDLARPLKPQGIDDEGLRHVAQIQSLKLLMISPSAITDAGLAHLASLDKLESITLAYSPAITGTGFAGLEQLATLGQLGLQGVPVNAEGLRAISKLSQLDRLMLSSVNLKPTDVAALSGLKNLQSLYIATDLRSMETDLGDAIVSAAAQMPALRSLLLSGGLPLSRASFAAFAGKTPALEELAVEVLSVADGDLTAIDRWKNLRRLSLGGAGQLTDDALERIGELRQLTQLSLSGSGITDAGLEHLRGLTELEYLSLFGTRITGNGLAALVNCQRLTTLELAKSAVNDATVDGLTKLRSVEFLDLSDTPLGDKSLDTIARLKNLRMLTIQRTEITAAGLMQHLKKMPRMQVVIGLKATADEGQQLAKAFPGIQFRLSGGNLFQADGSGIFIADAVELDEPVLETVPEPSTPKAEDGAAGATPPVNKQGSVMLREIRRASEIVLAAMANEHGYRLAGGQGLVRVAPPFDPIRMDYYRTNNPTQAEAIPSGPAGIVFRWHRDRLQQWSMTFGGSSQQGYGLEGLLNALVGFKSQEIEGPKELLEKVIPGDWVVRADQPAEKTIEQLNTILQRELSLPLRLAIRTVERPVYVARGDYHFTPVPGGAGRETMIYTDSTVELDVVEIFARELVLNSGSGGGTGTCDEFFNWLGEWIDAPIVSEVSKSPASEISWRLHGRSPFTDQMRREDREAARVLANIRAQTGFTFEKEMRPVKILFVESAP